MTIRLLSPELDRTLHALRDGADRLAADRDRAAYDVDSLLAAGWRGAAADAFADAWADWLAGARDVLDGLHALTAAVEATHRDLGAADVDATARSRHLSERLG